MKPTNKQKAAAWRWAADEIEVVCSWILDHTPAQFTPVQRHALEVVAPSLRQRARIIARNARVKK